MLLRCFAQTIFFLFFLIAQADASANATASPAPPGNFSSTASQPGTLLSYPPSARDEERAPNIEGFGLGPKLSPLLTKSKQAVMAPIGHTPLWLKLRRWRRDSVHPSIVYTNLKLDQVKGNSLSHVRFPAWVRYVDSYNSAHPGEEVSLLAKFEEQFDDSKLATMLERAKKSWNPSIRALGTRLQKEQMKNWRKRSVSSKKLHNLLQSDPSHPILLTGRKYRIWNTYLSEYNPGRSMTPIKQLLYAFDDESLSSLLIASKQSEDTVTLATNLQLELEKEWLSYDLKPRLAFIFLKLDKNPYDVLNNLELESWTRYAKMYQEKTKEDVTLAQVLVGLFKKDVIEDIIRTAKSEDEKKLAENLETMLKKKLAAEQA